MFDVWVRLEDRFQFIDNLPRRVNRGTLGQGEIDEQLGPVGGGKKLLLHELHAGESHDEESNRGADHDKLYTQHGVEHFVEATGEPRWLVSVCVSFNFIG